MMMERRSMNRGVIGTAASLLLLLPLMGCSAGEDGSGSDEDSSSGTESSQSPSRSERSASASEGSSSSETSDAEYEDGTYTAKGYYGGAPSYMTFTVTLEDGQISDVSSELMPENNDTSRGYQERFAAALPDEVVGKRVDEVEVGKLAGSSSCGEGFNDALATIREQALGTDEDGTEES
jgi:uncharacterized protein with FMN-binding domain